MKFDDLELSDPILRSLQNQKYKEPTPIQIKVIPEIANGKDVMAAAQTGTGKTAAFVLPILNKLSHPKEKFKGHRLRALIVTPTRELAIQVRENINTYSKYLSIRSAAVYGGARIHNQRLKLRKGVDILVATPGRLLDLHNQKSVNLKNIEIFVLDEADQMLDMGFIHDIKKISKLIPDKRQNLMFTATFSNTFRSLAKEMSKKAIEISVTTDGATGKNISHHVHPVDKSWKSELLIELIEVNNWDPALVFTRTKHGADRLQKQLTRADISTKAIHGNKTQNNRLKALESFKNNKIKILVATDVAARGLDIKNLPQVVNFDVPTGPKDYIHRIGRTGRGGEKGQAISLVSADEIKLLNDIEKLLKYKLKRIEVEGFEPTHVVPDNIKKQGNKKNHNKGGFRRRKRSRKG